MKKILSAAALVALSLSTVACVSRGANETETGNPASDEQGIVATGADKKEDNVWIYFNEKDRNKVCLWVAVNQSPRNDERNGDGSRDTNVFLNSAVSITRTPANAQGNYIDYGKLKNLIRNNIKGFRASNGVKPFNELLIRRFDEELTRQKSRGTSSNSLGTIEVMQLEGFEFSVAQSQGMSVVLQDLHDKSAGENKLFNAEISGEACPKKETLANAPGKF